MVLPCSSMQQAIDTSDVLPQLAADRGSQVDVARALRDFHE